MTFSGCKNLKKVKLSNNITYIGGLCFGQCMLLTQIEIPASVKTMGDAFSGSAIETITFENDSTLESVDIGTFSWTLHLRNITLPDSVKEIKENAFAYANISEFVVPKETISISPFAFNQCRSLSKFIIPANCFLQELGLFIFEGCTSLETFECNESLYFTVENYALFNKNKTSLVCFPPASECKFFYVPISIERISAGAFYCCKNIVNILIPDKSVKVIERYVFSNCTSLSHINIPCSVVRVETHAFSNCFKLQCGVNIDNNNETFISELFNISLLPKSSITECNLITCRKTHHYRYFLHFSLFSLSESIYLGFDIK